FPRVGAVSSAGTDEKVESHISRPLEIQQNGQFPADEWGRSRPRERAMRLKDYARVLRDRIKFVLFRLKTCLSDKEEFECPVCKYRGPFIDLNPPTGLRKHAKCPKCGALERHRLQYLVITDVLKGRDTSKMKMLHFAPEPFFRPFF